MLSSFRLFPPLQAFRGFPSPSSLLQGPGASRDSPLFRIPAFRAPSFHSYSASRLLRVLKFPYGPSPLCPFWESQSSHIPSGSSGRVPQNGVIPPPHPAMGSGDRHAVLGWQWRWRCLRRKAQPHHAGDPPAHRRTSVSSRYWDHPPKETPPGASAISPRGVFAVQLWNPARTKHSLTPPKKPKTETHPKIFGVNSKYLPQHTHTTKSQGHPPVSPFPSPKIFGASSPSPVTCGM